MCIHIAAAVNSFSCCDGGVEDLDPLGDQRAAATSMSGEPGRFRRFATQVWKRVFLGRGALATLEPLWLRLATPLPRRSGM